VPPVPPAALVDPPVPPTTSGGSVGSSLAQLLTLASVHAIATKKLKLSREVAIETSFEDSWACEQSPTVRGERNDAFTAHASVRQWFRSLVFGVQSAKEGSSGVRANLIVYAVASTRTGETWTDACPAR
jgi:hypothetical protein